MTMIESVARAAYAKTIEIVTITRPGAPFMAWDELPEEQRRLSMAGARAGMEALMNPSARMIAEGESAASFGIGKPTSDDTIPKVWQWMLRAALDEGKP